MNKESIRRAITVLAGLLPMRRRVLLESQPDLACNTFPVFQQMLTDEALADVRLTWLVRDKTKYEGLYPQKNVTFVNFDPDRPLQKWRAIWLSWTSRCVVFCNKVLWPPRRGQFCLFLGHGTPIKQCRGIYTPGTFCNRWLCPSPAVQAMMEEQLGFAPGQALMFGYPRNDALLHPHGALDRVVERRGRRCLFWLPTFRQQTKQYDRNYTLPGCGLPLLGEEGALDALDRALGAAGVLLVLKPHPVQDMSAIRAGNYENFRLVYDSDLTAAGVQLYEVLADADALLTDYSSVYCDFLLTGRPIGLTFDDLAQYTGSRGLVMEDIRQVVKGRYLYTPEDLIAFVGELQRGEDTAAPDRQQANAYYNARQDDQAAARTAACVREFLQTHRLPETM